MNRTVNIFGDRGLPLGLRLADKVTGYQPHSLPMLTVESAEPPPDKQSAGYQHLFRDSVTNWSQGQESSPGMSFQVYEPPKVITTRDCIVGAASASLSKGCAL